MIITKKKITHAIIQKLANKVLQIGANRNIKIAGPKNGIDKNSFAFMSPPIKKIKYMNKAISNEKNILLPGINK